MQQNNIAKPQQNRIVVVLLALLVLGVWGLLIQQLTVRPAEAQASKTKTGGVKWMTAWTKDGTEMDKYETQGWEPFSLAIDGAGNSFMAYRRHR